MCMQDIRMGRTSDTQSKAVTLANGVSTNLVSANTRRIRLIVHTSGTPVARVAPEGVLSTGDGNYGVAALAPPLILTIEEFGLALCGPWTGSGVGAACTVIVTDVSTGEQ